MNFRLRLLLWYVNTLGPERDYDTASVTEIRNKNKAEMAKRGWLVDGAPLLMAEVKDLTFVARDNVNVLVRYYLPKNRSGQQAMLFFHGGGFVTRDINSHDKLCRRLAHHNEIPVFSVNYRLAPESKFPIPVNDCEDAFNWLVGKSEEYDFNNKQIVLCGDSAGANLATVVSQRSRGVEAPKPYRQVLIYPTTDGSLSHPSIDEFGEGYFLTREKMQWFVDQYKRSAADVDNPDMSPLFIKDLSNQPPTYLCTAGLDPLKDEGVAYAQKLKAAGVSVMYREFADVIHGFANMPRIMPKASGLLHDDIRQFLLE